MLALAMLLTGICVTPVIAQPLKGNDLSQDWQQLMTQWARLQEAEQVSNVNNSLNRMLSFADDRSLWQLPDYWSTPAETLRLGQGDCEDYAILKYFTLRKLGVAADKLWLTFARVSVGGPQSGFSLPHMVLAYYPHAGSDPMILDNLVASLYPASQRPDLTLDLSFNTEVLRIDHERFPARQLPQWRRLLARMPLLPNLLAQATQ